MPIEEENVTSRKGKHGNQAAAVSKPAGKFVTPVEFPPSTGNSVELQTKISSRRKSGIVKAFSKRENWNSETIADKRPSSYPSNSALDLKVPCLRLCCPVSNVISGKNIGNNSIWSFDV